MMENLGSNIKPHCVQTVGQTLGVISKLCSHFEDEADVTKQRHSHGWAFALPSQSLFALPLTFFPAAKVC